MYVHCMYQSNYRWNWWAVAELVVRFVCLVRSFVRSSSSLLLLSHRSPSTTNKQYIQQNNIHFAVITVRTYVLGDGNGIVRRVASSSSHHLHHFTCQHQCRPTSHTGSRAQQSLVYVCETKGNCSSSSSSGQVKRNWIHLFLIDTSIQYRMMSFG